MGEKKQVRKTRRLTDFNIITDCLFCYVCHKLLEKKKNKQNKNTMVFNVFIILNTKC